MKVKEILVDEIMPSVLTKQAKLRAFAQNVAKANATRPLTIDEKAAAIIWQGQMQRLVDKRYAERLKKQLVQARKLS